VGQWKSPQTEELEKENRRAKNNRENLRRGKNRASEDRQRQETVRGKEESYIAGSCKKILYKTEFDGT